MSSNQEFISLLNSSFSDAVKFAVHDKYSGDSTELALKHRNADDKPHGENSLILTLSAHMFRAIITLTFNPDETLDSYLKKCFPGKNSFTGEETQDYLFETLNMLVGDLKRALQPKIPTLGISTPNMLKTESLEFVSELKIEHTSTVVVHLAERPLFVMNCILSTYGIVALKEEDLGTESAASELEFF